MTSTVSASRTMLRLPSEGDGVLIFDDTGFAKQGKCSVGVARQYSGTLGKTGNCQVTVNCHYAERTIAWPVATRLYLPEYWASDADRRRRPRCPRISPSGPSRRLPWSCWTGPRSWGVRWACVTADADYGDNPNFLDGLEQAPPASRGRRPRRLRREHESPGRATPAGRCRWSRPKRRGRGAR